MTRRLATSLAATICLIIGSAVPATAQHYHGSGHYGSGHYDYHPGHYDYHNGHYDYHPGHYDWHDTTHVHPQSYVTPNYPTYGSPPRTAYYGGGHSHDHYNTHTTRRISYGGFSHIDDLAIALENQANFLCLELYYNYQHNPGWAETYREAYEILMTAKYIHGLEHAGNRDKIRQAVAELDGLFHHVENDVAHWTAHHHRHVGHGGLTAKLEDVEETLHHFMDDIGARPSSPAPEFEEAPPAGGVENFPQPVLSPSFPQ